MTKGGLSPGKGRPSAAQPVAETFSSLGLRVFERGWLSSNNILLQGCDGPCAVVDTGYALHAAQTVALVSQALDGQALDVIVNTHLHSDHCGGNAALQHRWPAASTAVPVGCFDAARNWEQASLTFTATDQRCDRFRVDGAMHPGDTLTMGGASWEVHAAPGHDPTALMLFEPVSRVLISADALWERRLAIVFPELVGEPGFDACLATLATVEALRPRIVIPGHGRPFVDVAAALAASRQRVEAFARDPQKHRQHAVRALVMFRMLELQQSDRQALERWLLRTPITAGRGTALPVRDLTWAGDVVASLVRDGALRQDGAIVTVVH